MAAGASTHVSNNPSTINELVAQLSRQQQQQQQRPGRGQGDYQDRNNSISSNSQGGFQQAQGQPPLPCTSLAPIAALNHYTASFPAGPQQDILPNLPWFTQMQVRRGL